MSTHPEGSARDPHQAEAPSTEPPSAALPDAPEAAAPAPGDDPMAPASDTAPYVAPLAGPYTASSAAPAAPYAATPYTTPYGAAAPAPRPGTDGLSIAALVTGLLSLGIVPIILGSVSLSRIKKSGAAGRGMAIAGIALGALSIIGWTLALVLGVVAASDEEFQQGFTESFEESLQDSGVATEGESAADATAGTTEEATEDLASAAPVETVAIGQCVAMEAEVPVDLSTLESLDCATPHDAEFFAVQQLPEGEYPGEESIFATGDDYCLTEFNAYVGIDYNDSSFDFGYFYPTVKSWAFGDRQITCYAVTLDGSQLTTSVHGIAQ